jgi:predicted DNA-binding WGR domain protein
LKGSQGRAFSGGRGEKGRCEFEKSGIVWRVQTAGAEGEALRRFEFVGGSSAKFWEAGVEGTSFVVAYGRLGTSGQRKAKAFATESEAQRECDKKVAEKLREGYVEVAAGSGAPAEPAAPSGPAWPARRSASAPSPAQVAEAIAALNALGAALGGRSWAVGRAVRRARRALDPLGALSPGANGAFTAALEGVLGRVGSGLALADAIALLGRLDAGFFAKALGLWGAVKGPAAPTIAWLKGQASSLGDDEAALAVALVVADRRRHDAGFRRRRDALWGPLGEHLRRQGSSPEAWARSLDAGGDAWLGRALSRAGVGA